MTILGSGLLGNFYQPPTDDVGVKLFIKADGANNSTNIFDSSPNPKTIIGKNTAKISTDFSKYGGSSIFMNQGYLEIINPLTLNDYTLEFWIYLTNSSLSSIYSGKSYNTHDFSVGQSEIRIGRINVAWDIAQPFNFILGQWYHVAFCRLNSIQKIFVNGTSIYSSPYGQIINFSYTSYIGIAYDNYQGTFTREFSGYIDSIRLLSFGKYFNNFNPETDTGLNV